MNAHELFELAPFGAIVSYSDGQPRPPERHKKKLAAWNGNNSKGRFVSRDFRKNSTFPEHASDGFALLDASHVFIQIESHFSAEPGRCNKTFEIVAPLPVGSIVSRCQYRAQRGDDRVEKIYQNEADFLARRSARWDTSRYWIMTESGLIDWAPAKEEANAA